MPHDAGSGRRRPTEGYSWRLL